MELRLGRWDVGNTSNLYGNRKVYQRRFGYELLQTWIIFKHFVRSVIRKQQKNIVSRKTKGISIVKLNENEEVGVNLRTELLSKVKHISKPYRNRVNVENLLQNSVGIGEHGDIMDTIEKELEEMSKYHDLLEILSTYFPDDYNGDSTKQLLKDSAI